MGPGTEMKKREHLIGLSMNTPLLMVGDMGSMLSTEEVEEVYKIMARGKVYPKTPIIIYQEIESPKELKKGDGFISTIKKIQGDKSRKKQIRPSKANKDTK